MTPAYKTFIHSFISLIATNDNALLQMELRLHDSYNIMLTQDLITVLVE